MMVDRLPALSDIEWSELSQTGQQLVRAAQQTVIEHGQTAVGCQCR